MLEEFQSISQGLGGDGNYQKDIEEVVRKISNEWEEDKKKDRRMMNRLN